MGSRHMLSVTSHLLHYGLVKVEIPVFDAHNYLIFQYAVFFVYFVSFCGYIKISTHEKIYLAHQRSH